MAEKPRSWRLALAALATCAIAVSTPYAGLADPREDKAKADKDVAKLHDSLEGTSQALAEAYLKLEATKAKLPAARARLAAAEQAEAAAAAHNAEVGRQLTAAQANEARAVSSLAATNLQIETAQANLDNLAAQLFQGDRESQLSVALGASNPDDFATRIVLADTLTAMTEKGLSDLAVKKAEGQAQEAYLTAVRAEVAALKLQAEAALAAAETARVEATDAKVALESLVAEQESYAASVEKKKASEQKRLVAAVQEQERLKELLQELARKERKKSTNSSNDPGPGSSARGGYLDYPANGPITSEFGMRYHPIYHYWRLHSGTDFGIACGTPIYATANGRIYSAGWAGGYGNRIMVNHGIVKGVNLVTSYNHLSRIVKSTGRVSRGQLIGYSGTTGASTGCHLHFETYENGSFVNPRRWI